MPGLNTNDAIYETLSVASKYLEMKWWRMLFSGNDMVAHGVSGHWKWHGRVCMVRSNAIWHSCYIVRFSENDILLIFCYGHWIMTLSLLSQLFFNSITIYQDGLWIIILTAWCIDRNQCGRPWIVIMLRSYGQFWTGESYVWLFLCVKSSYNQSMVAKSIWSQHTTYLLGVMTYVLDRQSNARTMQIDFFYSLEKTDELCHTIIESTCTGERRVIYFWEPNQVTLQSKWTQSQFGRQQMSADMMNVDKWASWHMHADKWAPTNERRQMRRR